MTMLRATLTAELVQHDLAHAQTCDMLWDGMLEPGPQPLPTVLSVALDAPVSALHLPCICPHGAQEQ